MKKTNKIFGIIGVFTLFLGLNSSHVKAADFVVDTTDDLVDLDVNDATCLTANNNCSLRAAVQQANAEAGADTINLPEGIYTLTLQGALIPPPANPVNPNPRYLSDNTSEAGDLDILEDVTITGAGRTLTFITTDQAMANGRRLYTERIFDVVEGTLTLREMTLQGASVHQFGGAVQVANLTAFNASGVVFINNESGFEGGALNNLGTADIDSSSFINNRSLISNGGAIGNGLSVGRAGGFMTINNTLLQGNSSYTDGGAITNYSMATLTILNSTLTGNVAGGVNGGGIQADGGAIDNIGTLTLKNVTISGNTARDRAAGLFAYGGTATVINSTIANNTADARDAFNGAGGGIYVKNVARVFLTNTILAGNTEGGNQAPDCAGAVRDVKNSIVQNTGVIPANRQSFCKVVNPTNSLINIDPLLDVFGDNGGNLPTQGLLLGSPAINAADQATCVNELSQDARGVPRVGACDIGAFEFQVCGDGVAALSEQCDDGNVDDNDGCSSVCRNEVCGDNITQINEVCDDGNAASRDGCSGDCQRVEVCGDGFLNRPEGCDDGNLIAGDGCSDACTVEPGFNCVGEPSDCDLIPPFVPQPEADCGNTLDDDNDGALDCADDDQNPAEDHGRKPVGESG